MDKKELKARCDEIAKQRFSEIRTELSVYLKTIKILFKFLDDHKILLSQQGALSLSDAEVRNLTVSLNLRKKANRSMGKCLVDILSQIKNLNLYKGGFPNLPNQVERMLVVNPAMIPWSDYGSFLMLKEAVVQPLDMKTDMTLDETGKAYFLEFLASAYVDGALWDDFHREVIHVTFDDVTFSPLTINLPLTRTDTEEEWEDNRAFFRYWLSPRTEMYFLRLILFWKKHEKELGLNFDGFHVFPSEWRGKEEIALIPKMFERWTSDILSKRKAEKTPFGIRAFRQLCIIDLLPSVPPFVMSALSGLVLCDSFHLSHLSLVDNTLSGAVKFERSRQVNDEQRRTDADDEIGKMLEEGRGLLNSDETFLMVTAELKSIVGELSRKAPRSERMAAAKAVEALISTLPNEESGTSKKFLLNVIFFGRWLVFMLKETTYDQATIERRLSMIFGKFIFMLRNNAIHELSTDTLVDIIVKTYRFYDSEGISKDIMEFTDHLFLYQESIYPEMKWEALPWGKGNVLYKEKILRTKPFISFQNVRDAIGEISRKGYSDKMAKRLRAAIILGFYAGLRIIEVAYLKTSSLMLDGVYSLAIRDSKTKSGIRNINLSLLLPPKELTEVLSLFEQEGHFALTSDKYIFSDEEPEEARKSIPIEVAKIFKRVGLTVRFHHLRHSFANWFILRYWCAIYGKEVFPNGATFLEEDIFNGKSIVNLRQLFFGFGPNKKLHDELFSYSILVLARIMGHYGPITTMNSYLHIIDWIFRLSVVKKWSEMTFDLKSANIQDLMQLSYPALPESLKKRSLKGIAASDIVNEQLIALRRKLL